MNAHMAIPHRQLVSTDWVIDPEAQVLIMVAISGISAHAIRHRSVELSKTKR